MTALERLAAFTFDFFENNETFVRLTRAENTLAGRYVRHSRMIEAMSTPLIDAINGLLRRGLASRPGPKLTGWMRRAHRWLHLTLIWGLFFVAVTGFLLGLTSPVLLKAGGFLPIAPPLDLRAANEIVGLVHIIEFYALGVVAAGHAGFHIWRHYRLRDNALRIMAPKKLHKYL